MSNQRKKKSDNALSREHSLSLNNQKGATSLMYKVYHLRFLLVNEKMKWRK